MLFRSGDIRWFETEHISDACKRIFREYSALGVTGFVDCGIFGAFEQRAVQQIADLEAQGELRQRICGCVMAEDPESAKTAVERLRALHARHHSDMYNIHTLKIVNDGTVESRSCALRGPYPDGRVVEPMLQGEALARVCLEAAAEGFHLHIHAIGDRAVHETLMAEIGRASCRERV